MNYSVCADCTPGLSHCCSTTHEVKECLLSFIPLGSQRGESLTKVILKYFDDRNIDIQYAREAVVWQRSEYVRQI